MKNIIKIKKGTDNLTELMYEILENLPDDKENVIEFEKGTYNFYRKGSSEYQLFSSGGLSVKNYVIFPIIGKKNLTIDGNGSEFVFCDRVQPIIAQCCENIAFKNFSMDYSFLRYAYADITEMDENGFEIAMDRDMFDYYVDGNCLCFKCGEDVLSTKIRRISVKRIEPTITGVYHFSIGDTLAERSGAALNILVDAEKTPDGIRFTYREDTAYTIFEKGDRICIAYDNNREAQAFWCERSKNINVENVTIYRGGGMGFVADLCEEILLDGYKIELKEGREEYYTTTADGVFVTNCKGKFTMCNSHISDTYDDAMNIHGYYTVADEIIDKRTVKIIHPYPSHAGIIPCFKGDEIHFSTTDTYDEVGSAVVENITYDEMRENVVITFDRDVELKKGMLLENPGRMPEILLENNVVERCPHIRISSKNMVVRNNKLHLDDFDLYIHDLIAFWGESGATDNVLIEGNDFGNAEYNIVVRSSRPETSNHLHKNITVRNNTFAQNREKALVVSAVENFVEENNTFGGMTMINISKNIERQQKNFWSNCLFHPTDAVEDPWGRRILDKMSEDKAIKTIRIYNMLEDIVYTDMDGKLCYDFRLNDLRIDYLTEKGYDLIIAYGMMPECIAANQNATSSMSKNKTRYKGKLINTSTPTDYKLWEDVCYEYTKHIIERYGEAKVASWHIHCFNEPDIQAFFLSDLPREAVDVRVREYCKLYESFEKGIRRASTKLHIGGPALAGIRAGFLDVFLNYVKEQKLQFDYIAIHNYGGVGSSQLNEGSGFSVNYWLDVQKKYLDVIEKCGFKDKEIVVDEWGMAAQGFFNIEECPSFIARETEVYSSYYVKLIHEILKRKWNISKLLICLSGQHEMVTDFSGFRNFFTLNFFAKPIYNAHVLASRLYEGLVGYESEDNVYVIPTKNENGDYSVLLTYCSENFSEDLPETETRLTFEEDLSGKTVTVYCIDKNTTNPYRLYEKLGLQENLSEEEKRILREEGKLKPVAQFDAKEEVKLKLTANAVYLLEVK